MVGARLTRPGRSDIVKSMRRFIFAALCVGVAAREIEGQQVPARELLEFPITAVAELAPLAGTVAGGLWNPASIAAAPGGAGIASAAALNTPIAQGVTAQHVGVSGRLRDGLFGGASFTHAGVSDLIRTDTDPSTDGGDIPYGTSIYSATIAWRRRNLVVGGALRYRSGEADMDRGGALSSDVGLRADSLFGTRLRAAFSTFLLSPTGGSRELRSLLAAAQLPVYSDSVAEAAIGYAFQSTRLYGHEHYLNSSVRWRRIEARGGVAQHDGLGTRTRRLRLGLGLQHARYLVGLAREDSGVGLGASYQFTLTAMFK